MDSTERPRGPHLEWTVLPSEIGPLLLAATPEGLVRVEFHAGPERVGRMIGALVSRLGAEAWRPDPGREVLLAEPIRQLKAYFAGTLRRFDLPLDWRLSSGFNRQVLLELDRSVPYGSVVGYGELAARAGQPGAAQAVGNAMGSNPLPLVVACHRVVENDGGSGASGAGWRPSGPCSRWRASCRSRCSRGSDGSPRPRLTRFPSAVRGGKLPR